jgi:hypothetical protein
MFVIIKKNNDTGNKLFDLGKSEDINKYNDSAKENNPKYSIYINKKCN